MFENMFNKEKVETPQGPSFEQIFDALPDDLKEEYQTLSNKIKSMAEMSGFENEISLEEVGETGADILARYDELEAIGRSLLQE